MKSKLVRTGILLAGGASSRMGGPNKALLPLGDRRLVERILDTLDRCFDTVIIAAKDEETYLPFGHRVVTDRIPVSSPLAGIHAGLLAADGDHAFCTACDTPFLRSEVIREIVDRVTPDLDIVVPRQDSYFQPLCAVYSRRCIAPIETMLQSGIRKTDRLFVEVAVRPVGFAELAKVDPDLDSFVNINTPEDFQRARQLLGGPEKRP